MRVVARVFGSGVYFENTGITMIMILIRILTMMIIAIVFVVSCFVVHIVLFQAFVTFRSNIACSNI